MKIIRVAKIILAAVLAASPAASALAGDLSAVINGRSVHVNSTQDWNENNFGLGFEYQFETQSRWKKQLMVNGFRDSNEDMSYMVGASLQRNLFSTDRLNGFYVAAGVNAFLMTRRDVNKNRPFPAALPSVSFGNRDMGFNVTYLPMKAVESLYDAHQMDASLSGIFFVQFKVSVDQLLFKR